jgi:hypothetical protein
MMIATRQCEAASHDGGGCRLFTSGCSDGGGDGGVVVAAVRTPLAARCDGWSGGGRRCLQQQQQQRLPVQRAPSVVVVDWRRGVAHVGRWQRERRAALWAAVTERAM